MNRILLYPFSLEFKIWNKCNRDISFLSASSSTITLLTSPTRDSYQHIFREVSTGRGKDTRPAVGSAKVSSGRNYRVFPATRQDRCARRIVISNTAGCNVTSCVCTMRNTALSVLQIASWCYALCVSERTNKRMIDESVFLPRDRSSHARNVPW